MRTSDQSPGFPAVLKLFLLVNGGLYLVCLLAKAIANFVLHLDTPYSQLYLGERFPDFFTVHQGFGSFHHKEFFTVFHLSYPAPTAVAYECFILFGRFDFAVYISFISAAFLIAGYLLARSLHRRGLSAAGAAWFILLTILFAFPIHFEWIQANIEIVVWCLLLFAVLAVTRRHFYLAGVLIGIAGSMKIFPLVYLGILLSRRKFAASALALVTLVATTLASLWLTYPSIAFSWAQTNENMASIREHYVLHLRSESAFDHSVFALLKSAMYVFKHLQHPPHGYFAPYLSAYMWVAAVGGTLLYIFKIRHLPFVNQVLCLTIAAIALPPLSFDYTLIHLYVPWALLVFVAIDAAKRGVTIPGLTSVFVLLAFLFACESEIIYRGVRIGGQMKSVALLLLWLQALRFRFPLEEFDGPAPQQTGIASASSTGPVRRDRDEAPAAILPVLPGR